MSFLLRKVIDYGVWVVFFTIFGYSSLFYVTKDAVPGDRLYGAKLATEKVLIASSSILNKQVDFQINFVARRYDEINKVLASKYGSESLRRLDGQVVETGETIANIKDPEQRKEAASKYVAQLNYISSGLANEQQRFVPSYQPNPTLPPEIPTQTTIAYVSPPPSQTETISNQINTTQETIQQTIENMNQIQQNNFPAPTEIPTPTTEPTRVPTSTPIPTREPTPTNKPTPTPHNDLLKNQENNGDNGNHFGSENK